MVAAGYASFFLFMNRRPAKSVLLVNKENGNL
jgi:hypothetical protein